ncbi:MAG: NAD(P)-binding protein [Desulfobacterales bacterium]|nr:NAD(P)-binding protein [Desulfobacterales bacterium]
MIESKIIVVGGGPSGSACARSLKQAGLSTLVLDKKVFPRQKICAGWVTPKVFEALDLKPKSYPHTLTGLTGFIFIFSGYNFLS